MQHSQKSSRSEVVVIGAVLAFAAVVIRLTVLRALPAGTWSADLSDWQYVIQLMRKGENPYNVTTFLNWPPLWMQMLYVFGHVSAATHRSVIRVIQLFLIALEAIVTFIVYVLLSAHWNINRAWLIVVIGLVIDPVAIILTVIHGNFDLIVALAVILFLWSLTSWSRHHRPDDWLLACLFLGVGILAKVTPLVLVPLLAVDWRLTGWRTRVLGLALLIGPVVLGMSVIFTLGPHEVIANVIRYRSMAGSFGITGIINAIHWPVHSFVGYSPAGAGVYTAAFLVVFAVVELLVLALCCAPSVPADVDLAAMCAALLVMVPTLGPGFATQYAWWWLPVIVIVYALARGVIRPVIIVLYVIAIATYVVYYAFIPAYGSFLLRIPHPSMWNTISSALTRPTVDTYVSLPLFTAYTIFLLVVAVSVYTHWRTTARNGRHDVPEGMGASRRTSHTELSAGARPPDGS
jgi:hypothetical protein